MRPDDSSVSADHYALIRQHAKVALEKANAVGRFPTPVNEVMDAAKLIVADGEELTDGFLARVRMKFAKAGKVLKSALSKVWGLLDVPARIVYIDKTVAAIKQVFIKLHEAGHSILPWQRDLYCAIEDCEKTLAPEVSEAFDREANTFATEVLFQLDSFQAEAADSAFGINVPLKLKTRYGASAYAAIRRYVSSNHRSCLVLVLDPPVLAVGDGFTCSLRRVVPSDLFLHLFGELDWQQKFTPDDEIGAMVPLGGRKMSRARELLLTDRNGVEHVCIMESFKTPFQVFVLIHEKQALTALTLVRL